MDLNCAAMFVHVVDAKGFSAAARKLDVPKTTVSKKVGDLETELGVRLLNRTTRALTLTETGKRVYEHAVEAVRHMEAAKREAQALQERPAGMLRLGAPSGIINSTLIPIVTDFMALYPEINITMLAVNAPVGLEEGKFDTLIWVGDVPNAVHAKLFVARVSIGLFASLAYINKHGMPKRPKNLVTHQIVAFEQALRHGQFAWHLQKGAETCVIEPEHQPRYIGDDAIAIFAAAAAGIGIAALPHQYVTQCSHEKELIPILPEWEEQSTSLTAYFLDGSSASLKTRLFLDYASAWIKRKW